MLSPSGVLRENAQSIGIAERKGGGQWDDDSAAKFVFAVELDDLVEVDNWSQVSSDFCG